MTDDERRIVEWLRGVAEYWWGDGVNPYEDAADAIERGDHRK